MKKAFTMIELLVVIGILGILMAVLLGTFSGSTESARSAKCLANMRNLAMAAQSYGMSSGYYPNAGSYKQYRSAKRADGVRQTRGWIGWNTDKADDPNGQYIDIYDSDPTARMHCLSNGTLWASLNGAREAFICPSHVRYAQEKRLGTPLWSDVMNAYFDWASKSTPRYHEHHGRHFRSFRRPDKYLLFAELPYSEQQSGEISQTGSLSGATADPVLQYSGCDGGGNESIGFNHKDGKNLMGHVCFADGHVEKLRAPKSGSVTDLTKWLCVPHDTDGDFDVSFDGKRYNKVR